ncbi:MAG TPA: DUF1631 domain-containing protein [Gammaproteobacteria bacterium]
MSEKKNLAEEFTINVPSAAGEMPPLIQSVRDISLKHLQKHIQSLFSSIDDNMFEYANKADSNEKQTLYFDAMRQLRLEKKAAAQHYFQAFDKYFSDALKGVNKDNSAAAAAQDFSFSSLSLVEEDDLEESLAVTNTIEKSSGLYREYLSAIVQRINHVVKNAEITSECNPVSPDNICRAFAQCVEKLSIALEIKLIVYKLFEKQVASQLEPMYREINDMLLAAGVLPTLKFKGPVKSQAQEAKTRPAQDNPQQAAAAPKHSQTSAETTQEVSFDSLRQLLSMHRGQSNPQGLDHTGAQPAAAGPGGGGGGGFYVADDVLSGLTALQSDFLNVGALPRYASVEEIKNNLLSALGKDREDGHGKAIENEQSDVIDIVSMMFEFILEDKTLSDRIRAEIARLQIPVIKVAILDKKFFDQQSHPARLLLNELAYAGTALGSSEQGEDDLIFHKVEYVVNRVLAEFQTTVGIFDELLEEFKNFVDTELQDNRRSEKLLEQTKQKVSDEIESRIREYRVPKLVYDLLVGKWKDVLTMVGMRHGCKGPMWSACLDVINDLVWSVQPKLMTSEKQALTRSIPRIIKRLQEGLKLISVDQKFIQEFLDQLETLHLKCLKGTTDFSPRTKGQAPVKGDANDEDPESESEGNPFAAELGDFEYFSVSDDFTQIKLSAEAKRSINHPVVRDMEMGTWVEFFNDDKTKRGKLSWRCDFTGDYTFVDRRYRLVADIAMDDLIKRLDSGGAAIVKELPLLDRAINAVVGAMTKYMQSANNLLTSNS